MGRRRRCFRVSLFVVALTLGASAAAVAQPVEHLLGVSRFASVDFTDDQARDVFAGMSSLLQTDDDGPGSDDIACDVSFALDLTVAEFDDPEAPGVISSRDDMVVVMNAHDDSDVKVVQAIEWCGHEIGPIDGTYWGCSRTATPLPSPPAFTSTRPCLRGLMSSAIRVTTWARPTTGMSSGR